MDSSSPNIREPTTLKHIRPHVTIRVLSRGLIIQTSAGVTLAEELGFLLMNNCIGYVLMDVIDGTRNTESSMVTGWVLMSFAYTCVLLYFIMRVY